MPLEAGCTVHRRRGSREGVPLHPQLRPAAPGHAHDAAPHPHARRRDDRQGRAGHRLPALRLREARRRPRLQPVRHHRRSDELHLAGRQRDRAGITRSRSCSASSSRRAASTSAPSSPNWPASATTCCASGRRRSTSAGSPRSCTPSTSARRSTTSSRRRRGQRFHPSYTPRRRADGRRHRRRGSTRSATFVEDVPEGARRHRAAAQPQPHLRRPHQGHRRPVEGGGDQLELHRARSRGRAASSATCARTSRTWRTRNCRIVQGGLREGRRLLRPLPRPHGGDARVGRRSSQAAVENLPAGPVNVDVDDKVTIPDKAATYRSIEGLIQHFELFMWNRRWETPVDEVYGATETANGELGFYVVADGSGTAVPGPDAAAVVHPLRRLPASDGRAPDQRRAGGAGEPEHHRGGAGSVSDTPQRTARPMGFERLSMACLDRRPEEQDPGVHPALPEQAGGDAAGAAPRARRAAHACRTRRSSRSPTCSTCTRPKSTTR